ncbi:MAG: hypothetical protein E7055_14565 [Lentisphaerae bacterium]|nr:hypothetical protein [Lentisphaerota bacterium]
MAMKQILAAGVLLPGILACADVVLVKDGQPQAEILLAQPATKSAQLGAFELQHHIKLITGAELPIVKEKSSPAVGTVIRIGGENESIKEEASVIKFRPGEILLTGGDTADYGKVDYKRSGTYPSVFSMADSTASVRVLYSTQAFYNAHGTGFNMQMLDGHVEYSKNRYPHKTSLEIINKSNGWPDKAYPAVNLGVAATKSLGFKPFWGDED